MKYVLKMEFEFCQHSKQMCCYRHTSVLPTRSWGLRFQLWHWSLNYFLNGFWSLILQGENIFLIKILLFPGKEIEIFRSEKALGLQETQTENSQDVSMSLGENTSRKWLRLEWEQNIQEFPNRLHWSGLHYSCRHPLHGLHLDSGSFTESRGQCGTSASGDWRQ